jgi:hypothetical protein
MRPAGRTKKKKRLQPWDNCKRLKFGWRLPHLGASLTPSVDLTTWYLVAPLPYCKEGATDSHRDVKRKTSIKSSIPAALETSERELDRTFQAILTRSAGKIFRARNRRGDFSHSYSLSAQLFRWQIIAH